MNNKLPKTKIDEKTGIEYHLEGDYYIPNLTMPKQEKITLNKYGRMRLNYLKEHKKAEYSIMLLEGTLNAHLKEIGLKRMFLHAFRITFLNPADNRMLKVEAPLPPELEAAVEALRIKKKENSDD